jgi:hypothetical protein
MFHDLGHTQDIFPEEKRQPKSQLTGLLKLQGWDAWFGPVFLNSRILFCMKQVDCPV